MTQNSCCRYRQSQHVLAVNEIAVSELFVDL